MLLVGGAAVNFHGYQRHSADIDFWIETSDENLVKLLAVFQTMGYELNHFPDAVQAQEQNISIKFSPADFDVELITRFALNKSFDEAFNSGIETTVEGVPPVRMRVLAFDDLITSKIKSGRPKDLLDVQQLQQIKNL